ncbi:MAG: DUF1697 domain-containing protein [Gaiellaceae bacterium]
MPRQVALLRGINLARARRVGMADLRELLEREGYGDVRTHLQSGNVVLSSPLTPRRLEAELERLLERRFGFSVPVLVRTRAELAKVVAADPLRAVATDDSRYLVSFLSRRLPAKAARELEAADVAPERIAVAGREIYAWLPGGFQRSRAAKLLDDSRLGVTSTARNWKTVAKLLELAG